VAEIEMRMAIDPFKVVGKALVGAKKMRVPRRIVSVDYDEEADVLYVKFRHARMVDSESLDDEGLVIASLDERGRVAGLVIMEASRFVEAS
jgi:uncharacterized protein YuzE